MHKKTKLPLVVLLLLAFGIGVGNLALFASPSAPQTWSIVQKLIFVALVYWWFHEDSKQRNYNAGWLLRAGVIFLAIVALPIYFFRSRGAHQGAISCAKLIGFCLLWAVVFAAGAFVGSVVNA